MKHQSSAVAIYETHTDAEAAVKCMQESGFDMKLLSIIGRDYRTEDHVVGYYKTGDRLQHWGRLGAFWGGVSSLLGGEAFFWMPEVGPVLVHGPLVASIVGTLEGKTAHGGLTALGSALHGMGIPKDSVMSYESALKASKFLLVVHGGSGAASKAGDVLRRTEPIELAAHRS